MKESEAVEELKNMRLFMQIDDENNDCKFTEYDYKANDMAINALEKQLFMKVKNSGERILSQLYCDDTEVTEEHLSNYRKCSKYHKKLAELLEELKALKNGLKIKCDNLNEALEKGKKIGYNNAIDDFVNACKSNTLCQTFGLRKCDIDELAEQLKVGEQND